MPVKKTKSNSSLAIIGSVRTGRLNPTTASEDDRLHKIAYRHVRWSARAIQILCGLIAFFLYVSQDRPLLAHLQMSGTMILMSVVGFLSPFLSAFLGGMYVMNIFGKWSSRRLMSIETSLDLVFSVYQLALFSEMLRAVGDKCPAGKDAACDRYNWAITWTFFSALAWVTALVTDAVAWYRVSSNNSGQLTDEQEMALRRARMTT